MAQGYLTKKRNHKPRHRNLPIEGYIGVNHLTISRRLQRLAVDMAAECSYARAAERMIEHHGIELHGSLIRSITMKAGEVASELLDQEEVSKSEAHLAQLSIQMDGVMVPVVSYKEAADRRKAKKNHWQEMRVGVVHVPGQVRAWYACSFKSADELGDRLSKIVRSIGGDASTKMHGIGDGALWIPEQGERVGGSNYSHLVDYYHYCEYIHAAFEGDQQAELKIKRSKTEAKEGAIAKVRRRLFRQLHVHPKHPGVAACIRYITNRPGQFKYDEAIAQELPIGSGRVESANRSLIQKRLKLPGAWWDRENAAKIASLRALRANGRWLELWQKVA